MKKLTIEEQEELQQNLDTRKRLSDERISLLVLINKIEEEENKLVKRYYEILKG